MVSELIENYDKDKKEEMSTIITQIFNNVPIDDTRILNSKFYKFFKYIHTVIDIKNIWKDQEKESFNFLKFIMSLPKNPYLHLTLSSMNLATTITAVLTTTTKTLEDYNNINKNIMYESLFQYGIHSETYRETMKYCNTATVEGGKRLFASIFQYEKNVLGNHTPIAFVANAFGAVTQFEPQFFNIAFNGVFQYFTVQVPTNYFNTLRKEATPKLLKETSESKKINDIKTEIEKISMYKKQKYTDEEIQELLHPEKMEDKDPNKYKFAVFYYMKEFKKKFKKYWGRPELLLLYCNGISMTKGLITFVTNKSWGIGLNIFTQYVMSSGYYEYDWQNTSGFLKDLSLMLFDKKSWYSLLSGALTLYYGNDDRIKQTMDRYVNSCIQEITQDIRTIFDETVSNYI
jgi:hypothetical protein